jgi:hypothetical protein
MRRQDSGHSAARASSVLTLYRLLEPAPPADDTLGQLRILSTGALLWLAEPVRQLSLSSRELVFEIASLRISRQCRLNNLDFLAGNNRVGGIDNDLIIGPEAGYDLDLVAEVVAGSDGSQHDFSVFHNSYL